MLFDKNSYQSIFDFADESTIVFDGAKAIYDKLGFKVIIMDDQDLNSIAGCLKPKLGIN
jgi:hypothetical protein